MQSEWNSFSLNKKKEKKTKRARDKANGQVILPSKVSKAIAEMIKKNLDIEKEKLYLQYLKQQSNPKPVDDPLPELGLAESQQLVSSQDY